MNIVFVEFPKPALRGLAWGVACSWPGEGRACLRFGLIQLIQQGQGDSCKGNWVVLSQRQQNKSWEEKKKIVSVHKQLQYSGIIYILFLLSQYVFTYLVCILTGHLGTLSTVEVHGHILVESPPESSSYMELKAHHDGAWRQSFNVHSEP